MNAVFTVLASTYTRSGTAYALDTAGTVVSFTANAPRITDNGILLEDGLVANEVLRSRDFTNSTWVKSNITAALDQTGADGTSNTGTSLTATADNGTVLQSITSSSNTARRFSVFMKRITGTGEVDITADNGTTWARIDGSINAGGYTRVSIGTTTPNPVVGIRMLTNGDAVAVDFAQEEKRTFNTSPVVTTSAAVTRSKDNALLPTDVKNIMNRLNWSVVIAGSGTGATSSQSSIALLGGQSATKSISVTTSAFISSQISSYVSANLGSGYGMGAAKVGFSLKTGGGESIVGNNGTVGTASGASAPSYGNYNLGTDDVFGSYYQGYITRATWWNSALSDAALKAFTQ